MNRKFVIALLFGCLVMLQSNLNAQENNEAKTLFGDGIPIKTSDIGIFVAPTYGFTQLDGSSASLFNLRGGISMKDKISFGAYFNISLNQIRPQSETIPGIYMDYWSVGGFAEYTVFSKKVFHLSLPIYFGYGEVEMDNEIDDLELGEANLFQIEPSVLLEVNLHKYVRFNIGAGYRIISEMTYRNFNQSDISGFSGYAGLKLGLFR